MLAHRYSATSPAVRLSPHGRRDPAAGDPCLLGDPHGRFQLQIEEAHQARVPGHDEPVASPPALPGGAPAQPAAGAGPVSGRGDGDARCAGPARRRSWNHRRLCREDASIRRVRRIAIIARTGRGELNRDRGACGAIGPIPRECRAGRPDTRVRLSAAIAPIGARQSGDPDRAPPGGNERSRARAPERLDSRRDARSVARIRGAAGARVRARMPRRSACGEHRAMGGPAHALRLSGIRSQPALHRRDERYRIPLHGSQELPAPGSGIATAERLSGDHR